MIGEQRSQASRVRPTMHLTGEMDSFSGADFVAHPLIRGGHMQTLLSLTGTPTPRDNSKLHWVELEQGDRLALMDDQPEGYQLGDPCLLIVHGICGCSESSYMLRMSARFNALGVRVFRLNLRGCGVGVAESKTITHAGRSDDVLRTLEFISSLVPSGPISAIGISLGGSQLLRAFGTVDQHASPELRAVQPRMHRIAAVSPPVDLLYCSNHLMKWRLRPYGLFFIRQLLSRIPEFLLTAPEIVSAKRKPPRTMREFDERITAPLGGFRDAKDYYESCAALRVVHQIRVPALVLAADDDPIVPLASIQPISDFASEGYLRLVSTRGGGHVGFLSRGQQRFWMDELLERWFEFQPQQIRSRPVSAESHQRRDCPHPSARSLQNG